MRVLRIGGADGGMGGWGGGGGGAVLFLPTPCKFLNRVPPSHNRSSI